jgi:O-antigen/teichoic acid export membrane protein
MRIMNKKTSLGKNILIFGLGTSLSKLMSVLLVGLYTMRLERVDYGYYDILITVVSMATPFITLQITDGLYRHLLESPDDADASRSVTGSFAVIGSGLLLSTLVLCTVNLLTDIRMGWLLPGYFITTILFIFSQQTARGLRRNVAYAMSGVVYTSVMLTANIIFIVVLNWGVESLLYSIMIADLFGIVLIELKVGVYRRIKLYSFDFGLVKTMCRYSIPLLPNAMMWWFLMLLCRVVIGAEANGLFAVSSKFPALLMTVFSIFGLAWQESAITEYDSEHRDEFYSKTFNLYMRLLLSSLLVLLSVTRGVTTILIGSGFSEAWLYIPYLYIGSVFAAFSQFYGTGYLSAKKTIGLFFTTLTGVGFGVALLFTLPQIVDAPRIDLYTASLSQMTAYVVMFLTCVIHTRKFFRIRIELPVMLSLLGMAALYTYGYYLADLRMEAAMFIIALPVFYFANEELIGRMLGLAARKLRERKG